MNSDDKKKKSMNDKIEEEIKEKLENNEELDDSDIGYLRYNYIEDIPNNLDK